MDIDVAVTRTLNSLNSSCQSASVDSSVLLPFRFERASSQRAYGASEMKRGRERGKSIHAFKKTDGVRVDKLESDGGALARPGKRASNFTVLPFHSVEAGVVASYIDHLLCYHDGWGGSMPIGACWSTPTAAAVPPRC